MKKLLLMATFVVAALAGCKEEAAPVVTVDPDLVKADEVRLIVTLPASVAATKAADKFYVAGSFNAPNDWKEKGVNVLSDVTKGKFTGKLELKIPVSSFNSTLEFKVQRNGEWKYVEKDNACAELAANRKIGVADAGKTVEVTIENFRNTGTCPD